MSFSRREKLGNWILGKKSLIRPERSSRDVNRSGSCFSSCLIANFSVHTPWSSVCVGVCRDLNFVGWLMERHGHRSGRGDKEMNHVHRHASALTTADGRCPFRIASRSYFYRTAIIKSHTTSPRMHNKMPLMALEKRMITTIETIQGHFK